MAPAEPVAQGRLATSVPVALVQGNDIKEEFLNRTHMRPPRRADCGRGRGGARARGSGGLKGKRTGEERERERVDGGGERLVEVGGYAPKTGSVMV